MGANAIGIDVGGTKIRAVCVDCAGRFLRQALAPTPKHRPEALAQIVRLIKGLSDSSTMSVGIGVPGPVDFRRQIVRTLPNLQGWKNVPLSKIIQKQTGLPCTTDNDAKCFLLAEMKIGAAKGRKNVLGLVIGTGVGGAIAINGEIYRGADGFAGEAGHMVISGKAGHHSSRNECSLEALASGEAVRWRALSQLSQAHSGRKTALSPDGLNSKAVFYAARKGDALASEIVGECAADLGVGIANLVNILNPEIVVIGGGLGAQLDLLLPKIRAKLRQLCFPPASAVKVVRGKVDAAGAVGAAFLGNAVV